MLNKRKADDGLFEVPSLAVTAVCSIQFINAAQNFLGNLMMVA